MTDDRRLRPPEEQEKFIDSLIKEGLFETKQAAMMFAAALGYSRGEPRTLGKGGEGVRWQVFERNQDSAFVYALAIVSEKNITVLEPDPKGKDTIADSFESYVASGFEILNQELARSGGDYLDAVLLMLAEARRESTERQVGLEGLSPGALDVLGL